jgi:hypothetical protein
MLESTEVSLYRPYIYIPRLIDFKTSKSFNAGIHADLKQFVTYWQFCNGGDLEGYLSRHEAVRERVPDIIIWRFLWQMFKTFSYLQNSKPGVAHRDILGGNIFLHWPEISNLNTAASEEAEESASKVFDSFDTYNSHEDGNMPDFYLGDFGHAAAPAKLRNAYRQDLINIRECFKKLIFGTLGPLETVQVDKATFAQQGCSTDLALIWQKIYDLERVCTIQEDLDLRFLEHFILFLAKLYPKSRTAPLHITGPTYTPQPTFFNSKEQLLARRGDIDGGPGTSAPSAVTTTSKSTTRRADCQTRNPRNEAS